MEILRIENLRKKFGTNEVLKGISLNVNKGDVISIIGKSGSGKSTFLRCINRLEEASEGNIYFEGNMFKKRQLRSDISCLKIEIYKEFLLDSRQVYQFY